MEAVTDVVFRHVVAKAGRPDIFFTEFTNSASFCSPKGIHSTRGRLAFTEDEHPMVAQIWGSKPENFSEMAHGLKELGFKGIDINMGCPDKSVVKGGAGSGLIRTPELAAELIAAAKEAGLPVSVKTRLGDVSVTEWRDWLTTLLEQDIVNLTVHLRTKKEMSKVPAHFELIDDIVALRDKIAPETLLTINGDIQNRVHGLKLAAEHPGLNGIMIGRGVFQDPFCFAEEHATAKRVARDGAAPDLHFSKETVKSVYTDFSRTLEEKCPTALPEKSVLRGECVGRSGMDIDLLRYHLDLFDHWQPELGRPYETLKRFYKIYIRDFDGAKELRDQLMRTKDTDEAREILRKM